MDRTTLPYLACLRTAFSDLAEQAEGDDGNAMRATIIGRLLGFMMAQCEAGPALQAACYAALMTVLSRAEELLADAAATREGRVSVESTLVLCRELRGLCASAGSGDFARTQALTAEIQRALLTTNTPQALMLCRDLVRIEADYNREFMAAVEAQAAKSEEKSNAGATARNIRQYDEEALLRFIRESFPEETDVGIRHSGFVSGGYSKFTMSIALSDTKFLPENLILRGDASATYGGASVVNEYRLIKPLYEHGVRVPQPLALEETGAVFGSPFLLVEKRPGIVIGHGFSLPQPNRAVCRDVAKELAAIHCVPVAAFGDQVEGLGVSSSDKALAWIEEGVAAFKPLGMPSAVFEAAFDWLRRNAWINDKAPRTLVHGDVHLANMLVHDDKVSAILDWEFAHIGNPAYDLGYFYFQAERLSSWADFLDAYGEAGARVPDEEQLAYAILFGATRIGVMACQSARVFTSGAEAGIPGAAVIGGNYYETTITRMASALEAVLRT